jgi:hypothetical protein
MTIPAFLEKLDQTPKAITFAETMAVSEDHYTFEPTAFENDFNVRRKLRIL